MTLVKHRDFRLVLSVMKAGTKLARHNVHGTVLIHVLSGHIRTEIFDASLHATAGQIISLDPNMEHEVKAVEDTALLITIAWPAGQQLATSGHQYASDRAGSTSYDSRADEAVWD
jgi:quercetin dioxygenase-like cupin family protein